MLKAPCWQPVPAIWRGPRADVPSPLAGLPVSIKDLFDVAGQVTASGSSLLADAPQASDDAVVVQRLRAAGAILLGRTNMSEFAFSGLGLNPHYGTPLTPCATQRIAGGSSSGAAVSVALDMAVAGLGDRYRWLDQDSGSVLQPDRVQTQCFTGTANRYFPLGS